MGRLRRLIWSFVRDPAKGLPASTLIADSAWHPLLRARAEALVGRLASEFGLKVADNLGQRLSKKMLAARPLMEFLDLATDPEQSFRTSTVHKVKGESLDAVLYVAKKPHVRAFLDGPASEDVSVRARGVIFGGDLGAAGGGACPTTSSFDLGGHRAHR